MSETRNIGGDPVYPCLTIRDYLAAQALQGLLARSNSKLSYTAGLKCETNSEEHYALVAYEFADAMLKARGE